MYSLALLFLIAYGVVYLASANFHQGIHLADQVCDSTGGLCSSPWWLLIAASACIVFGWLRNRAKA